ncbi:leucine-rich repeat-containing protein 45-like [Anneissia japonica]|uniref:leucine-rich repeat-containing protein 45-like n=1 Tax=Anneissia japonica TaxID=1529436 RepID=UPI00142589EC|nr:leucine-rich repeat-containing protein 45-like [Anneissia japonica]
MDSIKQTYLRLCNEHRIEVQQSVLSNLQQRVSLKQSKSSQRAGSLVDLSTTSLSLPTCAVFSRLFASDTMVTELRLSDCMIGDEGIKLLAEGLSKNAALRVLDLKGNNIRSGGTEALGQLLRHNHNIKRLLLEWNSLGLDGNAFAMFADGLTINNCLEVLDLRNNQMSHDSAGELAMVLQKNSTLKVLDLRWNNLGIVGGRSILNGLQHNQTIIQIDLNGNNIPQDLIRAVDVVRMNNEGRSNLTQEHQSRQELLTREIRQLKKEKRERVGDLISKIDKQEEQLQKTQRNTGQRIRQLQEALEERKTAFNSLQAKLSMTEAELSLAEQKSQDLAALLDHMKDEHSKLMSGQQKEINHEREERFLTESKLSREISSYRDKNEQMENKIEELERKCHQLQDQVYSLKEDNSELQAELKVRNTENEEKLQKERQRGREATRDLETRHDKEQMRLRQQMDDSEKSYKERIGKLEQQRLMLEEEVSRQKTQQVTDRMAMEDQVLQAKQRVKEEEQQRSKYLEDKIRLLQNAKDDLQQYASQQSQSSAEYQAKYNNATLEIESLKRKLEELNQELAGKTNETIAEVNKVQLNHSKQMSKLETQLNNYNAVQDRCEQLEQQLNDQSKKYQSEIQDRENRITTLQQTLRSQEEDFLRVREEEMQRASMLQSAFSNFFSMPRTPLASPRK